MTAITTPEVLAGSTNNQLAVRYAQSGHSCEKEALLSLIADLMARMRKEEPPVAIALQGLRVNMHRRHYSLTSAQRKAAAIIDIFRGCEVNLTTYGLLVGTYGPVLLVGSSPSITLNSPAHLCCVAIMEATNTALSENETPVAFHPKLIDTYLHIVALIGFAMGRTASLDPEALKELPTPPPVTNLVTLLEECPNTLLTLWAVANEFLSNLNMALAFDDDTSRDPTVKTAGKAAGVAMLTMSWALSSLLPPDSMGMDMKRMVLSPIMDHDVKVQALMACGDIRMHEDPIDPDDDDGPEDEEEANGPFGDKHQTVYYTVDEGMVTPPEGKTVVANGKARADPPQKKQRTAALPEAGCSRDAMAPEPLAGFVGTVDEVAAAAEEALSAHLATLCEPEFAEWCAENLDGALNDPA